MGMMIHRHFVEQDKVKDNHPVQTKADEPPEKATTPKKRSKKEESK